LSFLPPSGRFSSTGAYVERRGLYSTGVWVYDLDEKEKKKISEKAKDVEWLPTGDIYLIDYERTYDPKTRTDGIKYETQKYNYKQGIITEKGIKGVKFSLDGRYAIKLNPEYFDLPSDNDVRIKIEIVDLTTHKEIPHEKLTNLYDDASRISWSSLTWLNANRVLVNRIVMRTPVRDISIVDVKNNNIVKKTNGEVVGTNSDRSKLVIFIDGKFKAEEVQ
jgi:hypothetical protein